MSYLQSKLVTMHYYVTTPNESYAAFQALLNAWALTI